MTAGRRTVADKTAPLPLLPRPLSDEAGPPARPMRRRIEPTAIERGAVRIDGRARGIVIAVCVVLMALLAILPGLAHACTPEARAEGGAIRLSGAEGIERVKMEVGYRRAGDGGAGPVRTYYQVISAPVPADGIIAYRPPMTDAIVSAMVLEAKGPACD